MDNTETTPGRFEDPNERPRRKLRWDPTINAGHITSAVIGIGSAVVMTVGLYNSFDKRMTIQEERYLRQVERDAYQDIAMKEKFSEVKESLRDLKDTVNEIRRDVRKP